MVCNNKRGRAVQVNFIIFIIFVKRNNNELAFFFVFAPVLPSSSLTFQLRRSLAVAIILRRRRLARFERLK